MESSVLILTTSVFLVIYSYVLYPLLLWLWASTHFGRHQEMPARNSYSPKISVVIAAYNEQQVIDEKIRNTLALQYPKDRFEVLIGSDGSTDGTEEIVLYYPTVKFLRIEPRMGKANVLNTLIPQASGEIIILSDANTIIDSGALIAMVRHFTDPTVGGVCGRLVLTTNQRRLECSERTYWSYESKIKELESNCYSTIGANGGIFAIRKELFTSIPINTIIDDFVISLNVLEQGKRLLFESRALAYEEVSKSFKDEFWRKVRIGAGDLQVLLGKVSFFRRAHAFAAFAYLSHKVIRWLVPFLLIGIWVCSFLLAEQQPYSTLFWTYNLTLLLSIAGVSGVSRNRIVKAFSYLYSFNLALLIGYGRYLLGVQRVTWRRAQR